MNRLSPVLGPLVLAIAALAAVSGCSSSKKSDTPPSTSSTTTSVAASTTTEAAPSTSSTSSTSSGPARTTTTFGSNVTTTTPGATGPRITGFTVSPPSPVECNAPTMIQLKWSSTGAKSVALSIDGKLFAAFGGGPQDHLEPLACDGRSHSYVLTAFGNGLNTTAAKIVMTDRVS